VDRNDPTRRSGLHHMTVAATPGYDVLAPVYDELGDPGAHERWLAGIERLARARRLRGRRALDVACGTGSSFLPLLARGYEVTACDAEPAMAARARAKAGRAARVLVADMRRLPRLGEFDLVTCLDDALNHLTEPGDVLAALRGMRRNLAHNGLIGFDVALERAYAEAADAVIETADHFVARRGAAARLERPGGTVELVVDVFSARGDGAWDRRQLRRSHRHYPLSRVAALLDSAGLRLVAARGQQRGGELTDPLDEERDRKAFLLAAHA
jgi:SAM-dependent methyltransferase